MVVRDIDARRALLREALPAEFRTAAPLWIDGGWRTTQTLFATVDPTVGRPVLDVMQAGPAEVEDAAAAAQAAQPAWWAADGQDRARVLRRIADGIRQHGGRLGLLDTLDAGRPIRDTRTRDVERAARLFEFFAGVTDRLRGATVPVQPGKLNFVEPEPYGIVGAITPWNYPLTNAALKVAPALATGNAVVLKPAEESPLSALLLAWIAHEAGLPGGLLNVLNGPGAVTGDAIVRHPRIGKITFTGSTAVGRRLGTVCGELLKAVTLELGGKTAFIVFADSDLKRAADAAVFSAFNNAGQTCTAATRLLLDHAVADRFLDAVAARIDRVRLGDPLDERTQVGPIISGRQCEQIRRRVGEAGAAGADIRTWAPADVPPDGFFAAPTLVRGISPSAPLAREEVFGPVLVAHEFGSEDEAVALANDTEYGLATTVWTEGLGRAHRVARQVQSGLVWVNTAHSLHPGSPYGGYKQSGLGVEMGPEAVQQHMKTKSIWIESGTWQSPWA